MVEIQKMGKGGRMVNTSSKPITQTFGKPLGKTEAKPAPKLVAPQSPQSVTATAVSMAIENMTAMLEKTGAPDYVKEAAQGLVASLNRWSEERKNPPAPPAAEAQSTEGQ